jgi:uncharacterized membrane protein required for colicin V production
MNWLDLFIIVVIGLYCVIGWMRGFLHIAVDYASLGIGLLLAAVLHRPLGAAIAAQKGWSVGLTQAAVFIVLWIAAQTISGILLGMAVRGLPKPIRKNPMNRVLGVGASALKGFVLVALGVLLMNSWPSGRWDTSVANSVIGSRLVTLARPGEDLIMNQFQDALRDWQSRLGRDQIIEVGTKLPFKVANGVIDEEAEARLLAKLNDERRKEKLYILKADPRLRALARNHSQDMLKRGYFAHESPEGKDPFDRMKKAGITYRHAGENLAFAPTVETAHSGLMRSPGHKENIMDPDYRKIGIGAVRAGSKGIMFTQVFTD